jgi:hypothetical protein
VSRQWPAEHSSDPAHFRGDGRRRQDLPAQAGDRGTGHASDESGEKEMCRNIKQLHNFEPPATDDEVHAAALQYVRKISGTTKPSKVNEAAFARAVHEIAHISRHLLDDLVTAAPPKDRETEAARARERFQARQARMAASA